LAFSLRLKPVKLPSYGAVRYKSQGAALWRAKRAAAEEQARQQADAAKAVLQRRRRWLTSYRTQVERGLGYIGQRYGSPCAAWNHSVQRNWY
jgi:hypothetical protein